jgi:hypothetical protein
MNRERLWRRGAILVAVLVTVFACGWAVVDRNGGVLFAVAVGAAVAVAILGENQRTCSPRFLRRRG